MIKSVLLVEHQVIKSVSLVQHQVIKSVSLVEHQVIKSVSLVENQVIKSVSLVENQVIKSALLVEHLDIQTNDRLDFNLHISSICRSAANQLFDLNLPAPIQDEDKKLPQFFTFKFLCGVSKIFYEGLRTNKRENKNLNFYFNTIFLNARGGIS